MGKLDAIYTKLPVWAQHMAVSGYGVYWRWLRFGPGFSSYLRSYQERENYTVDQWMAWQDQQLRRVLSAALAAPYYQRTWTSAQKKAALENDLFSLPLLEKEPIRSAPEAFLRIDMKPSRKLVFYTSGSTGTPLATYWTVPELRQSLALREARSANWANVSFKMPRATFSGRMVEPDPNSQGPFYRYNAAEKQVYLSPFHLRANTARMYVQALKWHQVRWLTGYAVSYYLLAKHVLDQGLDVPPLSAVITTSEKVTDEMRIVMEEAYRCKVYEEYSTVENAVFASECEHGSLHISPDVAMVEILRPDGSPCAPGEVGEVVATNFSRLYQPLIRYRLGDLAAWDEQACKCGRHMPVIKEIVGRVEDVVIGPDGRQMVRFHGIFVNQPHIREGQIIQELLDHIHVKVVPTAGFTDVDIDEIRHRIHQRLTDRVTVTVELVDAIPRTAAGKFQAVVSHLPSTGQDLRQSG
jgi:phenylacetate-CoA ligase